MKRKLLILFIIIAIIGELIFVSTKFLGVGKSKISLISKIEKILGAEVEIKGKVQLKIFPTPKLVVSHMRIYDLALGKYTLNIRAPSFEATVPVFKFLGGNISFKDVILTNSKIDVVQSEGVDNSLMAGSIFKLPVKSIGIVESGLNVITQDNVVITKYDNLNLDVQFAENILLSGGFDSDLNKFNLNAELLKTDENIISSSLSLSFSDAVLDLSSEYSIAKKEFSGSVKLVGEDFQKFVFNNLFTVWFFFPDSRKYRFESSFDFLYSETGMNLSNGEIKGDSIEGFFAGKIEKGKTGNINFDLKKFDFGSILTEQKRSFISEEMAYLNIKDQKDKGALTYQGSKLLINGVFQEVQLQGRTVGPLNLNLSLDKNTSPKIENFSFQFTEFDTNIISGFFSEEDGKTQFIGNIQSEGVNFKSILSNLSDLKFMSLDSDADERFKINANFELRADLVNIHNIDGKIGDAIVSGGVVLDSAKSALNLNFLNFDSEKYMLMNQKDKFRHVFHYVYEELASRENNQSLLQEFLWLRSLFTEVDYALKLKNSLYNGELLDEVEFSGKLKHRFLEVETLKVVSDKNDFFIKAIVNLDEKQPVFKVDISALKADFGFLNYIEKYREDDSKWSKDLIVFPNFDSVEFFFKANFDHLKYHEITLKDAVFDFQVMQKVLEIKEAKGNIDNGTFKIGGSFIMDGLPQLAIYYNFERFEIGNLIEFFFNIPHFSAKSNLAGSLQTYGNTPYIMAKQVKSKNKFYLADVKVSNLAIPKIIQDIADLSVNPTGKFVKPMKVEVREGETNFKSTSGEFQIKNGILLLNNVKFSLPGLESASVGKVDIVNKTMKLNTILSFAVQYKVKSEIKRTGLTLTHSLSGHFSDLQGEYDLFQITSFVKNLKSLYIKAYNRLKESKN